MSHALSSARRTVNYVQALERENRKLRRLTPLSKGPTMTACPACAVKDADIEQAKLMVDRAWKREDAAQARTATLRTLYETLARKEHARLAWDHREGAALGLPHVSGDMEACPHPDCLAACAALNGEQS